MSEPVPDLGIPGIEGAELIGSGGFAQVYRAYQPELGRHVAVKVVRAFQAEATARRFMREARAIGALTDEEGILTVHEVGSTAAGHPYMVMQLCELGSLEDRLEREGTLAAGETVEIVSQVADALAAAHGQGIIHRDIKPANILLGATGRPLVADFGIAALRDVTNGVTDSMAFSAGFAAPEVFDGQDTFEAADVYALGATAYVLATGHRPYMDTEPDMSAARLIARVTTEDFTDPRAYGVDDALATVIERAMGRNPTDRPTMQQLAGELRALNQRAGAVTATRPAGVADPFPRGPAASHPPTVDASDRSTPPKSRVTAIVAAIGVVAAIGLIVFLASRTSGDGDSDAAVSTPDATIPDATITDGAVNDEPVGDQTSALADTRSINVAVLSNSHMDNIVALTPDYFTAETGIEVNYTTIEFEALEEIVTADVGEFDAVMVGAYQAPQFGANDLLVDLNAFAAGDAGYDVDDIISTVRSSLSANGSLYAAPFFAESSFLMYRTDVLAEAGLTMPDSPTWDQVAEIARAIDTPDMAGICLRGQAGWSDMGAVFTSVLNTFGGTWWSANDDGSIGESQVDQPEFGEALRFYIDLVNDAGQDNAENASFGECFDQYWDGDVAMWYDATAGANLIEDDGSPVRGLNGYALAPTNLTDASGWLWSWGLAIPANAPDASTAWDYVRWATSEEYLTSAAEALDGGWNAVPPGTRRSLYANPGYQAANRAFAGRTLDALLSVPIDDPGTTPRPGEVGVQFVGVPEFAAAASQCTDYFSMAIAGTVTVESALDSCHEVAQEYEQ